MSEFVVGQWVECVDDDGGRINGIRVGKLYCLLEVNGDFVCPYGFDVEYAASRFRPVEWQVGQTYRTTLEGVTATIVEIDSDGDFWGNDSREHKHAPKWCWSGKTGILYELKDDKTAPHLTPYLADEPSPAVETTEPSKTDPINPPHYQQHPSGVEAITITEHFGFNVGNAIKYLWRAGLKGDALTDLRKARWYVEREIQRQEKMKGGA